MPGRYGLAGEITLKKRSAMPTMAMAPKPTIITIMMIIDMPTCLG
jgi:hypothetical protein